MNGGDLKHSLTKKAGPLPVWGWAVLAGGLGGLYLLHKRNAAASSTTTTTPAAPVATDSGTVPAGSGGAPGGLPTGAAGDTTTGTGGTTTAGYPSLTTEIQDVAGAIGLLQGAGLVAPAGSPLPILGDLAAGGAAAAAPPGGQAAAGDSTVAQTAHPAAARSVNRQAGNPRAGQSYETRTLPDGRTAHVYAGGQTIVLPGTTSVKGTAHRAPAVHGASPAAAGAVQVNHQAGNPRAGQTYTTRVVNGRTEHVYPGGKVVVLHK